MSSTRVTCSGCSSRFTIRFDVDEDEDVECPACRSDDRDRDTDPETLECGVCDEEHLGLTQRERRSMAGQSFSAKICIIESGELLVHPHDGADLDRGGSS